MIDDPRAAERLARAILDDITLEHDARVRESRDLTSDLGPEIEAGRALYVSRVSPEQAHLYEGELLNWQGRARDRAMKLGGASVDRTRLLIAFAIGVAVVALGLWLALRR